MDVTPKKHNSAGCPFCREGIPLAPGVYTYHDPEEAMAKMKAKEVSRGGKG